MAVWDFLAIKVIWHAVVPHCFVYLFSVVVSDSYI